MTYKLSQIQIRIYLTKFYAKILTNDNERRYIFNILSKNRWKNPRKVNLGIICSQTCFSIYEAFK
ncbi:hypothetical protein HZS_2765 [Henneguya salminicola]|nr:hypothetical protein HZS_2765 [Henneguya salminicola]